MENNKKILFVGSLCSNRVINDIIFSSKTKVSQAAPKFYKLLIEGLADNIAVDRVKALTFLPISDLTHEKKAWFLPSESSGLIDYHYCHVINIGLLKSVVAFIYSFIMVFIWGLYDRKNKIILCDGLGFVSSFATILATRLNRIKVVGIITDIPGVLSSSVSKDISFKAKVVSRLSKKLFMNFDGYLLLTEQMNGVINPKNRPYIVIEGVADKSMVIKDNKLEAKSKERILLYAGGINEIYGIKKLILAFMKIKGDDLRLHIYGHGPMEDEMGKYMTLDSRIFYGGILTNNEIVQKEIEATLLVNPRSSKEEFTKYSFPSKNMEYMASGTPLLTTPLPGMPEEYNDYVFLFDDESEEGIKAELEKVFARSKEELHEFGLKAKKFVLSQKNNHIQSGRLNKLLDKIQQSGKKNNYMF
ncbi:colanic acid biosynthesis glycosyltransferase WcaL [Sedimentisphaera cyanobacteriorum]|uniref:Colanic acid biosynthesis glycosyltransferase WcaL n=1 Tax=Sedimentisphaera cyanobacteriorum TaxID=1940790 RepID=A0A1Q2HNX9_9BACT|nr:glycosyltransferase [Sedimentisphaera cyanobacteriorum]AQQ09162.1 colanic acid biosynthesis glycosyltransferase WcaL [Sedimentisphaera cyanobacteriorum]